MVAPHGVIDHYGTTSLLRRINEALRRAGPVDGIIRWADRTPLDHSTPAPVRGGAIVGHGAAALCGCVAE